MASWQQTETPAPARVAMSLRARGDQLLVLIILVAIWQVLSLALGTYWIGSPWGVATRLAGGVWSGEILRHASYTLLEAVAGFLIGGVPAVALPFALRRLPILTAILDPFMVGGCAPNWRWRLCSSCVRHRHRIQDCPVAITVFFIVYFSALAGVRALDAGLVQMAQVMARRA